MIAEEREIDTVEVLLREARRLLAAAGLHEDIGSRGSRAQWRWLIRPDVFDGLRKRLQENGALIAETDLPNALLGIPYDIGWPPAPAWIQLEIAPTLAWPAPAR